LTFEGVSANVAPANSADQAAEPAEERIMKVKKMTYIAAAVLLAVLTIPTQSSAQEHKAKRPHYIVRDLGTFGGPNSFFFSAPVVQSVSNRGAVAGGADTGLPDPYPPSFFSPDGHILHAFKWKNGVLTDLGTLPGGYSSTAYWVNERGLIMGGSQNGLIDPITGVPDAMAVLWEQDGEIVDLGTLGGSFSFGNAMNNRGQVVGLALNTVPDQYSMVGLGTETHAFIWQNGYMEDLGTLGGPDSWAAALNENGQVAGWAFTNSTPNPVTNIPTQDPFLWHNGQMIDLGTLGGTVGVVGSFSGAGGAINSRGQVVGTSNLAGDLTHHPFLWNEGSLIDLGTLGGDNAEAYWINDAGAVVGRADVPGSQSHHAFLWEKGVMTDLGLLNGQPCSTAIDVNSNRQVIIDTGICGVGGGPGALWQNGTLYDLNTLIPPNSGVTVGDVNFINDRAEIAATGILPNGDQHDLLLVPIGTNDDDANRGALATDVVSAPTDQLFPTVSRYGRFGRRTSAPK
jgi:probable HAF family extracellular repeat protein